MQTADTWLEAEQRHKKTRAASKCLLLLGMASMLGRVEDMMKPPSWNEPIVHRAGIRYLNSTSPWPRNHWRSVGDEEAKALRLLRGFNVDPAATVKIPAEMVAPGARTPAVCWFTAPSKLVGVDVEVGGIRYQHPLSEDAAWAGFCSGVTEVVAVPWHTISTHSLRLVPTERRVSEVE